MLPADRERDYRTDAWLQRQRIAVLRVGEFRFEHDHQGVLEDVLGLLGLNGGAGLDAVWTPPGRLDSGA